MGFIYEPRGRAREYAALACNIYRGCNHGCVYCFAPGATHKTKEEFAKPAPRSASFLADLEIELVKKQVAGIQPGNVLLCFTCDPYQELDVELKLTHYAIEILHKYGYTVTVLTKGGTRALRDLGLFGPGDAFATTLTLFDDELPKWEPGAASFFDRLRAIQEFHAAGIFTWSSLEPVINPKTTGHIIRATHDYIDAYKVGTLNHHELAKTIDWRIFAHNVTWLLDHLGYNRQLDPDQLGKGQYYIKRDLARWLE